VLLVDGYKKAKQLRAKTWILTGGGIKGASSVNISCIVTACWLQWRPVAHYGQQGVNLEWLCWAQLQWTDKTLCQQPFVSHASAA